MKLCRLLFALMMLVFISCYKDSLFDVQYKVIAHRGCWKDANGAENSLEGLSQAIRIGIDGVELDVCKTIDDSLIVVHGDKHGEYIISQTEFVILRQVRLSNGEVLPTLSEYLSYYKNTDSDLELIIEIKHPGAEELVVKTIEDFGLSSHVKLISFGWDICKQVKSLNPTVHVSYLNGDKTPQEIYNEGLNGIAYQLTIYQNNPNWLGEAHSLGMTTYVWNVNEKSDFKWSTENNIDYIVTDHPRAAKQFKDRYD